jgi:23S rRNA (guanine745-N1)-methyltransferase
MNDAVLPHLRCPNCALPLARGGPGTLRCPRGHSFDIAKQGYVTLTAGRTPHSGDTAAMVADRAAFLAAGHYRFIADALAQVAVGPVAEGMVADGLVVDAGTGTGYYLARVLDARPDAAGLGLDVSKPALRRAARVHPRADAALADLWHPLPLADGSAALVLDVFAPRNGAEFRRILRPGGLLVVVTPAADHLAELIERFDLIRVDPEKAGRVSDTLGDRFAPVAADTHRRTLRLTGSDVRTLVGMTPSARHVTLTDIPEGFVDVTAAVDVAAYRPA